MCGFVAVLGENATEPGLVERGVEAIKHRGPDGQGSWRSPCGRVALGHARLAIIDLSPAASQPMVSRDGAAVIAFNGEIYNFEALREKLDIPLRSTSDTEVLLELLRKYGLKAVEWLRGMFAFAYWDGAALHVVRDRLGIKPVFHAYQDGRLYVASEIQALIAMGVRPRLDETVKDAYLSLLYVPPPRTGLVGVAQLPPAHAFLAHPGAEPQPRRYWSLPLVDADFRPSDEAIEAELEDAIRSHLVADVPVGVFLSGGLDSSLIVAIASKFAKRPLKTFTVVFGDEGAHLDERRSARAVAEKFETEHRELRVSSDLIARVPAMVRHFGQPFGNPTALLTWAVCEAARPHAKVVLAGDGGDEVFGGYPRYQAEALLPLVSAIPRGIRRTASLIAQRRARERMSFADRLSRFVAPSRGPREAAARWAMHGDSPIALDYLMSNEAPGRDSLSRDILTLLPNNVLRYGDAMSMAASIEVRTPFVDNRLVEFMSKVPMNAKVGVWNTKSHLRRIASRVLPQGLASAQKRGYNPPIASWLSQGQRRYSSPTVEFAAFAWSVFLTELAENA